MYQDPLVQRNIRNRIFDILYSQQNMPYNTQFATGAAYLGGYVPPEEINSMIKQRALMSQDERVLGDLLSRLSNYDAKDVDYQLLDELVTQAEVKGAGFADIIKSLSKLIKPARKSVSAIEKRKKSRDKEEMKEKERKRKLEKEDKKEKERIDDKERKLKKEKEDHDRKVAIEKERLEREREEYERKKKREEKAEQERIRKNKEKELEDKIKELEAAIKNAKVKGGSETTEAIKEIIEEKVAAAEQVKAPRKKRPYNGGNPWVNFLMETRKEEKAKGLPRKNNKEIAALYRAAKAGGVIHPDQPVQQ